LNSTVPLLEVRALEKSFGGVHAVRSVDLDVEEGEILGLIGPNGAGKTTFFGLISGFIAPDAGAVRFDGQLIVGLRPDQLCRRGLVRTFQIVKPFGQLSVLQNVMVGALNRTASGAEARARALEVIELVGLRSVWSRPAAMLTLANRKRLEVARALAAGPRLLLLDEVLAGLNPTEVAEAVRMIRRINADGVTIVMIEHVMSAIMSLSQRVAVLNYGEKIAEGVPQTVAHDPRVLDAYLGNEFSSEILNGETDR
jgi:branched-chain amino acid transport system ATP-binding protein